MKGNLPMNKSDIYCVERSTMLINDTIIKLKRSRELGCRINEYRKINTDASFTRRHLSLLHVNIGQPHIDKINIKLRELSQPENPNKKLTELSYSIFNTTDNPFIKNEVIPGGGSDKIEKFYNGISFYDFI